EEIETALLADGGVATIATERAQFESVRERFGAVLSAWENGHAAQDPGQLDGVRAEYDRGLAELELALLVKSPATGNGEAAQWRTQYVEAEAAYTEAEQQWEEKRGPYEEALRGAEQRYENARADYVRAVDEIREELQKAPQEYEARYKDLL